MNTALERTSRRIVIGTWGCAAIVMVASAANAALTYGALGDNRALGLATGVAVDIALCVALIGDRQLYVHGLSSNWGRVLRITAAVMSLVLNAGVAWRDGRYFAAFLHAFLPVLLVCLTEYAQDVLLKFAALAREAERAPSISDPGPSEPGSGGLGRAGSDLTLYAPLDYSGGPAGRAVTVLPSPDGLDTVAPPSGLGPIDSPARPPSPGPDGLPVGRLVTGPLPAPVRPEVPVRPPGAGRPVATNGATTQARRRDKPRDETTTNGATKPATRARQTKPATAEQRRAWVRQQRDNGRTPTGADVHKQFPAAPKDGARIVRQVDAELEVELRAVAAGER